MLDLPVPLGRVAGCSSSINISYSLVSLLENSVTTVGLEEDVVIDYIPGESRYLA